MNHAVLCSLRYYSRKYSRWTVLFLPILFTGCFDSQSTARKSNQRSGIAALSRFFISDQSTSSGKTSENAITTELSTINPEIISDYSAIFEAAAEQKIAVPVFLGSNRALSENTLFRKNNASPVAPGIAAERNSRIANAADLLFNTSFNQLFQSVFKSSDKGENLVASKDDPSNPFTEILNKQESLEAKDAAADKDKSALKKKNSSDSDSKTESKNSTTVSGSTAKSQFLVIGDLEGNGVLKAKFAERLSDTKFVSSDGELDFNLFINPEAVDQKRSFYIDDINGDGHSDLLVANWSSVFGSVLMGDGNGGYRLEDTFFTGYEPTVPGPGALYNGKRQIVTLNMRSGVIAAFRSEKRYKLFQEIKLPFSPNYLLPLAATETSREFLMAAQVEGSEQILGWNENGSLEPVVDSLGADPAVLSGSFGAGSFQAFRVGNYASVVLTNHQGQSFNVANLFVSPRVFLVIGDLQQHGSLDVAAANLILFTPKK